MGRGRRRGARLGRRLRGVNAGSLQRERRRRSDFGGRDRLLLSHQLGRDVRDGDRRRPGGRKLGHGHRLLGHVLRHLARQVALQETAVLGGHGRLLVHVRRLLANSLEPSADPVLMRWRRRVTVVVVVVVIVIVVDVVVVVQGRGFAVAQSRRVVRHRAAVLAELVPKVLHAHRAAVGVVRVR